MYNFSWKYTFGYIHYILIIYFQKVLRHLVANGITRQPRSHFPNYVRFLLSQRTPAGQRRLRAQYVDLLACTHRPNRCAPPAHCLPLPGYHRADEFLFCGAAPDSVLLWRTLWQHGCEVSAPRRDWEALFDKQKMGDGVACAGIHCYSIYIEQILSLTITV